MNSLISFLIFATCGPNIHTYTQTHAHTHAHTCIYMYTYVYSHAHVLISRGSSSIKQSFCFICRGSNLFKQAYFGIGFFRRFLMGFVFANQCVSVCAAGSAVVLRNDDSSSVALQDDGAGLVNMQTSSMGAWVAIALLISVCCWCGVCSCMIRPCLRCLYYVAKFVLSTIHILSGALVSDYARKCTQVSVEVH